MGVWLMYGITLEKGFLVKVGSLRSSADAAVSHTLVLRGLNPEGPEWIHHARPRSQLSVRNGIHHDGEPPHGLTIRAEGKVRGSLGRLAATTTRKGDRNRAPPSKLRATLDARSEKV